MSRRLASIFASLLLLMGLATLASAQHKKKAPAERSVSGIVTNDDGTPLPGAIVQLKNLKTLEVRSFIAKEMGDYYFNGLSMDVDWEFHAEWNGKSSATRRVSTFDEHPSLVINLQMK